MEKTKVFIIKYALTSGIEEKELEIKTSSFGNEFVEENYYFFWKKKNEYFLTREEAVNHCEQMRKKKIESLKKQIAKLEKITF
jgi:hypothetical protein